MNKRNLTKNTKAKYERIVDEWFVNKFNGAAAYRKFYPNIKKEATASVNFSKIQNLPEIKKYISKKHQESRRVFEATHEGILKRLKVYLESDLTESMGMTVDEIKNNLPIEIRSMVTGHKIKTRNQYDKDGNLTGTYEEVELNFFSKERVQEMVNKHLGFYEKDNEQKTNDIHIHTTNDKHKALVEGILEGK